MPLFLSLIFVRLNDTTPVSFTLTSEEKLHLVKIMLAVGEGVCYNTRQLANLAQLGRAAHS